MPSNEAVLDFRVPPQAYVSRVVRESVGDFANSHGVGEADLSHFMTALGEAVANAIEHACATEPIAIEVRVCADRIVASVRDNGRGFDMPPVAESALPDCGAERGRGLPIMRLCSDIFAIDSAPGRGTNVILGRYFRERASGEAPAAVA